MEYLEPWRNMGLILLAVWGSIAIGVVVSLAGQLIENRRFRKRRGK